MGTLSNLLRRIGLQHGDNAASEGLNLADVEFRIPNMVCEGCAEKIDDALQAIPGVRDIRPNVPQKRIHVRYEPARVDLQRLKDRLAVAGFTAVDTEDPQ